MYLIGYLFGFLIFSLIANSDDTLEKYEALVIALLWPFVVIGLIIVGIFALGAYIYDIKNDLR